MPCSFYNNGTVAKVANKNINILTKDEIVKTKNDMAYNIIFNDNRFYCGALNERYPKESVVNFKKSGPKVKENCYGTKSNYEYYVQQKRDIFGSSKVPKCALPEVNSLTGGSKRTWKKYTQRKSPGLPANEYCGSKRKGNDGLMYFSKANKNGVCRWVKVK